MSGYVSSKGLIANLAKADLTVKSEGLDGKVVGLEDNTDGTAHQELEKVYYAKIVDFKQLESAPVRMHQEQWSVKPEIDVPGCVRIRSVNKGEKFVLAIKSGKTEVEYDASEDGFNAMKAISNNGMIKERFEFPVDTASFEDQEEAKNWEGCKWEVDVYFKEDGSYQEWCKIDLEVPSMETYKGNKRPPFPIELTDVMTGDRSKLTDDQLAVLDNLFETVFLTRNAAFVASTEGIKEYFIDLAKWWTDEGFIKKLIKIGFVIITAGGAIPLLTAIFTIKRELRKGRINSFLSKYGGVLSTGGANESQIREVESKIGFSFNMGFRKYLSTFGAMVIKNHKFYGVDITDEKRLDIVAYTEKLRSKTKGLPNGYAVFHQETGGSYLVIDKRDWVYRYNGDKGLVSTNQRFPDFMGEFLTNLIEKEPEVKEA